ncbi:MAG: hypothetical protein AAFU85_07525, partial [Planctomycetota bacterium]
MTSARLALPRAVVWPIWLMSLFSLSLPGRSSALAVGELDLVGVTKALIRVVFCVWLGLIAMQRWSVYRDQVLTASPSQPESFARSQRDVIAGMAFWWLFLIWSFASVIWSPLKSVSLGQTIGVVALTLLAMEIGVRVAHRRAAIGALLRSTSLTLAGFSGIILCVHVMRPDLSGLDRGILIDGHNGMVHPTAAGATASLGLAMLWLTHSLDLGRFAFGTTAMLSLGHLAVLLSANSRTALAISCITLGLAFLCYSGVAQRGWTA